MFTFLAVCLFPNFHYVIAHKNKSSRTKKKCITLDCCLFLVFTKINTATGKKEVDLFVAEQSQSLPNRQQAKKYVTVIHFQKKKHSCANAKNNTEG
jgi:hypothetical protein